MTERTVHDFSTRTLDGRTLNLYDFRGRVLLIVNTASECGFTPQYAGLQQLQTEFAPRGFSVIAFPCNQFGNQEPGDTEAIAEFCETRYHVDFPVSEKVDVNGAQAHPLFAFLKPSAPGFLGTEAIKWNFTKFLVDRGGRVVQRFGPTVEPKRLRPAIERLIAI